MFIKITIRLTFDLGQHNLSSSIDVLISILLSFSDNNLTYGTLNLQSRFHKSTDPSN